LRQVILENNQTEPQGLEKLNPALVTSVEK